MRIPVVLAVVGYLLMAVGSVMMAPTLVSLFYGEGDTLALLISAVVSIAGGFLLSLFRRKDQGDLQARDGFAIVTFAWVLVPMFGCLPYLFSGVLPAFHDAYFESVSGFTTTGASVIIDVEVLPHGLLLWRSLTHWLGGMGIIVLYIAILPMLGVAAMQLFKAEVAGPTKDKLTPRVAETARVLWGVYLLLTVSECMLLLVAGMPLFDAICHSFATVATGGFSVKNASIGFYNSPAIDGIVTLFMLLSGVSFALHYAALSGRPQAYLQSDELKFFMGLYALAVVAVAVAINFAEGGGGLGAAIRYASFNVASIMSCTGFATADFALWLPVAQVVLLVLMFPGGCAGSTAGGMKNLRVVLLVKGVVTSLRRLANPNAVIPLRLDGATVEKTVLMQIGGFVLLYLSTFLLGSMVLSETGLDLVSATSGTATCLAGVGPGLGSVGPMSNFAHLEPLAKWTLDAVMILGRLEILTVILLFSPAFWKK